MNQLNEKILTPTAIYLSGFSERTGNTAGVDSVIEPLNNLKLLIISIIGIIGIIVLAKNVMEFAQSFQQQDSSSMNSALKGIVAGLIMASISVLIAFLGF